MDTANMWVTLACATLAVCGSSLIVAAIIRLVLWATEPARPKKTDWSEGRGQQSHPFNK